MERVGQRSVNSFLRKKIVVISSFLKAEYRILFNKNIQSAIYV